MFLRFAEVGRSIALPYANVLSVSMGLIEQAVNPVSANA
jgi:hypothetical protein